MSKLITLLVPAYNEQDVLELFYRETCIVLNKIDRIKYNFEFLFINDGSNDNTINIIKSLRLGDSRVCYIDLSRNFGKEIALTAGFDFIKKESRAVIIIDADLQHPPRLIPEMIELWEKGNQDVYAKRYDRNDESFSKRIFSKLYYHILNKLSEEEIQTNIGDFRLLDRKIINAFSQIKESQRYNKGLFTWVGFKKAYIEYDIEKRKAGTTKWSFTKLLNLAIEGITSSSIRPLRLASFTGLIVSGIAFIWLMKVLIKTLFFNESVPGYPSLIITVLFLGGIQLLSLGLIGEYLGRVFKETKNRPLYFVNEKATNEK
ncbi:glycosyltransferase family 2 protein [Aureibaculum sp. 2210JD6-5]|uniref:glycosyltransferase family 2 protein n=1 Tax=Aureibaculum sp. 2210JD6-5 TaxID=3103957 RepID=UPI002AAE1647|nr:glycosyltransferase family 2 protein [Aureibaculum sp. 2210JD6-5]MDY7394200.1 glycosyltransferase family 2 protein [Aureibaculum sp. 2210JD6-5]